MCPKRAFLIENEKSEHLFWILLIQISVDTKFQLKLIFLTFRTKFSQERASLIRSKKSEYHHWILHIRISVGTKFQQKQVILTFSTKFAKKGVSDQKLKQRY